MVDVDLLEGVQTHDLRGDDVVHVLHRLQNPLAEEPRLVPVSELQGLVLAGGCPRGHGGATHGPVFQHNVNLDGRVAPGVENFTRFHVFDDAHRFLRIHG